MTALFFPLICIAIGVGLQFLFPAFLKRNLLLKNMGANLGLGLLTYVFVGYLGKKVFVYETTWGIQSQFGLFYLLKIPFWGQMLLGILLLDLTTYFWHWANHRISFLWKFHSVHHTDLVFDTTTAYRFHPVEVFLSIGVRSVPIVLLGVPVVVLAVFESFFLFFNTLEHSNIYVPSAWREPLHSLFITPALHLVHHTQRPEEHHSNFGTIFSFWDRFFGTLHDHDPKMPFKFGLPTENEQMNTLKLLSLPFKKLSR